MKTILLLFGGIGPEHEISVRSARNVLFGVDKTLFEVCIVGVDKQGNRWEFDQIDSKLVEVVSNEKSITLEEISLDCIFSIIHGTGGEDGEIQRFAREAGIPIVGCGVESSELCIDKIKTKERLSFCNLSNSPYLVSFEKNELSWNEIKKVLGSPVFLKTPNQGSSVGVHKVTNEEEYKKALKDCYTFDERVLIEQCIVGREIEFGVLGNEELLLSPPGEIIQGDDGRYSYDDKYTSGSHAVTKIVDDLPDELVNEMRDIVSKTYTTLGCSGFARVDLFLTSEGDILVNEVNTIPGFTSISMYPKLMHAAGIDITLLITRLIELALENQSSHVGSTS